MANTSSSVRLCLVSIALLGCNAILGIEEKTFNEADSGIGPAGAGGDKALVLPDCSTDAAGPGKKGPNMVPVGKVGGGCFWMDAREVDTEEYQEFVDSVSSEAGCSYQPKDPNWDNKTLPIVGLQWCAAEAFCKWANKRLCGTYQGPQGTMSEFQTTCTNGIGSDFNYVLAFAFGSQNCQDSPGPSQVGIHPNCRTPTGVLDLVGNVREWTNECGSGSRCKVRGGSYSSGSADDFGCEKYIELEQSVQDVDVGFRCCADK